MAAILVINHFPSELGITVTNHIEISIVTAQVVVLHKAGRVLIDILIVIQLSFHLGKIARFEELVVKGVLFYFNPLDVLGRCWHDM